VGVTLAETIGCIRERVYAASTRGFPGRAPASTYAASLYPGPLAAENISTTLSAL